MAYLLTSIITTKLPMDALSYALVDVSEITATTITGMIDHYDVEITGDFSFDGTVLTGGTVNAATVSVGSMWLIKIQGLAVDALDFASDTPEELTELMFSGNDTIWSAAPFDGVWNLWGGDDRVKLGSGDDIVDGGDGSDVYELGATFDPGRISLSGDGVAIEAAGRDILYNVEFIEFLWGLTVGIQVGSTEHDELTGDTTSEAMKDFIFGRGGRDLIRGGGESDRLYGNTRADTLIGNEGDDRLRGGLGDDLLIGNRDDDLLFGQKGDDSLKGGLGNDKLWGGVGADRIRGGADDDQLTGGEGSDTFVFETGDGNDLIADFEIGVDRIEILDGAEGMADLSFVQEGEDVRLSFADVSVLVQAVTVADLNDAGHFVF